MYNVYFKFLDPTLQMFHTSLYQIAKYKLFYPPMYLLLLQHSLISITKTNLSTTPIHSLTYLFGQSTKKISPSDKFKNQVKFAFRLKCYNHNNKNNNNINTYNNKIRKSHFNFPKEVLQADLIHIQPHGIWPHPVLIPRALPAATV